MLHTTYKGLNAFYLENDQLRLTFLPDYACKLASLVKKSTGREFLFQSPKEKLTLPHYGAPFSQFDSSGFDEVFPSIDACPYPDGEYKNIPVPDHGEVWAMKWKWELAPGGNKLISSVNCACRILWKNLRSFIEHDNVKMERRRQKCTDTERRHQSSDRRNALA